MRRELVCMHERMKGVRGRECLRHLKGGERRVRWNEDTTASLAWFEY